MAHSSMTAESRIKAIENKYNKKIKRLLDRYKDKTMQELWEALDELKAKMKVEWDEIQ